MMARHRASRLATELPKQVLNTKKLERLKSPPKPFKPIKSVHQTASGVGSAAKESEASTPCPEPEKLKEQLKKRPSYPGLLS